MGRHAKTKGIKYDEITPEERVALMEDMIEEHYPGKIKKISAKDIISTLISPGLNSLPNTLMETMMPNISPESVADATVQIFGGYDDRFGVSLD